MNRLILLFAITIATCHLGAQSFKRFMDRLNAMPLESRQAVADSFMSTLTTLPYIEGDTTVHFLYSGEVGSVAMAGDATNWRDRKSVV